MNSLKKLTFVRPLRKLVLPVLNKISRDISIKNPWCSEYSVKLNLFRHRGYWYHGRNREQETMDWFSHLIDEGQTVIEVGGHIGYMSQYFSHLLGHGGRLFVFEPGNNNLPYIRQNMSQLENGTLVEKAACNHDGTETFYLEDLTGQNNTLIKDFDLFRRNAQLSNDEGTYEETTVDCIKLDSFMEQVGGDVDFIKIDVEGAEQLVVEGARTYLEQHMPSLMVEVSDENDQTIKYLRALGYHILDPIKRLVITKDQHTGNMFCLNTEVFKRHEKAFLAANTRETPNGI